MNHHAVNAFAQFMQGHESPRPLSDLTRLASSLLSKIAKALGWKDWVFDSITCTFHAKSLIPDGLVKTAQAYSPRSFVRPATFYSKLDEIGVNLLDFCAVTLKNTWFACADAPQIYTSFVLDEQRVLQTSILKSFQSRLRAPAYCVRC